jgi:hypothetical protein
MTLTALSSPFYVVGVETPSGTYKLFQIICKKDGTLLVPFPYYKHASAQLIQGTLKAKTSYSNGLTVAGPVATNRVKYTHHPNGEAHFSQDGKILTQVQKRANSLPDYGGHLFTVQLQGLHHFAQIAQRDVQRSDRMYLSLRYAAELTSLKIVARLNSLAQFRPSLPTSNSNPSPWFRLQAKNRVLPAVLLSTGLQPEPQLLSLSFEEVSPVSPGKESILTFTGGFDRPAIALDHSQDTTFLMLISPAGDDLSQVIKKFGTVDFRPKP